MVSIEYNKVTDKWEVKYKVIKIDTFSSRVAALRRAFAICELDETGYFDGMTEEEISRCSM